MTTKARTLALSFIASTSCGGDDPGRGTLEIRAYGEAFVEEGIAASEVSDDWAVEFARFEVTVRDVVVAGRTLPAGDSVDLTQHSNGRGQLLGAIEVPAGAHRDASFTIASVHVVGTARKDGEEKQFDWRFDEPVRYHSCATSTEVPDDGTGVLQITVHADHFLYDSLVAEEPNLTFQPFADADTGDGQITAAELSEAPLGAFDPGNEEIDDLWSWLNALARTLGHVDGEGHCHTEPVD